MDLARTLRHLMHSPRLLGRAFPEAALERIETAVRASESSHSGEIRIALEGDLDLGLLWRDVSPRDRAIEIFSRLGVWDTRRNNGVLIYVLLADRDVEIVADRGLTPHVTAGEWESVCRMMETEFAAGRWERGLVAGVEATGRLLSAHFPPEAEGRDELPDRPAVL